MLGKQIQILTGNVIFGNGQKVCYRAMIIKEIHSGANSRIQNVTPTMGTQIFWQSIS